MKERTNIGRKKIVIDGEELEIITFSQNRFMLSNAGFDVEETDEEDSLNKALEKSEEE